VKLLWILVCLFLLVLYGNVWAQKNCVVTANTLGHVDKVLMSRFLEAFNHGDKTGEWAEFALINMLLYKYKKTVDVDLGDKAELLATETIQGKPVALVKIPGKGVLWVEKGDLNCR
jgi:hypothetical protein